MTENPAIHRKTDAQAGGIIFNLAASPDFSKDRIVFAAHSSGLSVSGDEGVTWGALYGSLQLSEPLPTSAVALSPTFATDQRVFAGVPGAVLRSHNGGQTWERAHLASPAPVVMTLAVSPDYGRDGVVFAGTAEDGVFCTRDRGARWGAWNFGLLDMNIVCLALSPAFASDQTLLAGTESGIFCSTNGGRAWRELEFSEDWAPVQCLAVSPQYAEDGTLIAGTEACGLFVSRDRGETWAPSGLDVIDRSVLAVSCAAGTDGRLRFLALTDERLLLSEDSGAAWRPILSAVSVEFTAFAVPAGLEPGAPVLIGTGDGRVVKHVLSAANLPEGAVPAI